MNTRSVARLAALAASAMTAAGLVSCAAAATPAPTSTPADAASATPDVYATSARRTLEAMAANATLTRAALTRTAADGTTPAPSATTSRTPSPQPASGDEPSPPPSATPTGTLTTTPPPTPTGEGGAFATSQPLGFIRSFDSIPTTIRPGDSITLTWSASGDWATLYRLDPRGTLAEFWEVPLTGTRTLPTSTTVRNAVRYVLFVGQGELTDGRMVTVDVLCPDRWFFANPPDGCPQSPAVRSSGATQTFERGRMYWVGAQGMIYVLFEDGGSPAYAIYSDRWQPGMAESDPSIVPPPGLYQPVRGFGLLWREDIATGPSVRDRLGWALAPEAGYEAVIQCDSAPRYTTCYLAAPGGALIVLEPERSGWYVRGGN